MTLLDEYLAQLAGNGNSGAAPVSDFGDPEAEYRRASETVALWDRSSVAKISLSGPDRRRFLHNLCTNDINRLEAGESCEAFLPNAQGKTLGYVTISALEESLWLESNPGSGGFVAGHLEKYHIVEDVIIQDQTDLWIQVRCVGAAAGELIRKVLQWDSLPARAVSEQSNPHGCVVHSDSTLALPSYDLRVPAASGRSFADSLTLTAQQLDGGWIGRTVAETIRIESGIPEYGVDLDDSNLPQELQRVDQTISFEKGCYIGQETVARIDSYGHVNRYFVGLLLEGNMVAPPGSVIEAGDKQIGRVSSSTRSPRLGAIALGFVRRGHEAAGTQVTVRVDGEPIAATVSALPFAAH